MMMMMMITMGTIGWFIYKTIDGREYLDCIFIDVPLSGMSCLSIHRYSTFGRQHEASGSTWPHWSSLPLLSERRG